MIDPYNENYVIRELGWGWEWKWGKNKSLKALVNNIPSRSPEPSQSSKVALLAYLYRREEVCFLKKLSKSVSILVEIRHSQKKKRGMKWKIYISNSNTESPLSLPARTQIPVITRLIYHSTAPHSKAIIFSGKTQMSLRKDHGVLKSGFPKAINCIQPHKASGSPFLVPHS